jgi:hypothetical protein
MAQKSLLLAEVGIGLGTTTKYLRRTTSAAESNGLGITVEFLRRTTSGAASRSIGTTCAAFFTTIK